MATNASSFCKAAMGDLQVDAEDTSGLIRCVMRNVPDFHSGVTWNIVIQEDDYIFWTTVLEEMLGEDTSTSVAVVGTPGIGKSTTVAFAIRLLWEKNKTVVCKCHTVDATGYYAQFTPTVSAAPPQTLL